MKKNLSSREKIKFRIRKRIKGSPERPRLVIYRSLDNVYANLIDDVNKKTVCAVSTLSKDFKEQFKDKMTKVDKSKQVGKLLAKKAKELNINSVVFDRNGYLFHGRIKAVADGAKEEGLQL